MRQIITSLIMAFCLVTVCLGKNSDDKRIIFRPPTKDTIDKPIYRAPVNVPVQGYYVSMQNTLYLSFTYYVGEVDVEVQNLSSGECSYGTVSSDEGTQAVPLFDNGSFYRITLTTSGGTQYEAEFQL